MIDTTYKSDQPLTKKESLVKWIHKIAAQTQPDAIHWVDGSQEEYGEATFFL
jgi:phosphoenolpyruvate carboxykinase (GTP)